MTNSTLQGASLDAVKTEFCKFVSARQHGRGQLAAQEFQAWLIRNQVPLKTVRAAVLALAETTEDQARITDSWMEVLVRGGVTGFAGDTPVQVSPKPSPTKGATTVIQPSVHLPAQTVSRPAAQPAVPTSSALTPTKGEEIAQRVKASAGQLYPGNIVAELASTVSSILVTGRNGTGKTTTMLALLYGIWMKSCEAQTPARFKIVDLQDSPWLGLESCDLSCIGKPDYHPVVEYLSGNSEDGVVSVVERIAQILRDASDEVDRRYSLCQMARRKKESRPVFEDYWVFINEYLVAISFWKSIGSKSKLAAGWPTYVQNIISRGRMVGVKACLSVQNHREKATSIPPGVAKEMSLAATGLLLPTGDGGYSSVLGLARDHYILDEGDRNRLLPIVQAAQENAQPVILTTQGIPRVGLLKDYTGLKNPPEGVEFGHRYPYKGMRYAA